MAKTQSQLVTETRSILGQTSTGNTAIDDGTITGWLNDGYRRALIELRAFPWTSADKTTTTRNITLDSGIVTIDIVKYLVQPANAFEELEVLTLDELIRRFPDYENDDTGIPKYFVRLTNTTAIIHPAPNSANQSQTCRMWGLTLPTALATSSPTGQPSALIDSVHDALPHWAAFRGFQFLDQEQRATQQLILFNQLIKAQKSISIGASRGKARWRFLETDYD